jgi:putative transposase
MVVTKIKTTKKELALKLGVSISSLYYKPKRDLIDNEVKNQIESVLTDNPAYGHKRISIALKLNKKRILRVMHKYNIKPYRRRRKQFIKKADLRKPITKYVNLLESIVVIRPNQVWVSDFTYIKWQNKFIYLATIIDVYSRLVVGFNISRFHNKELVIGALEDALTNYPKPEIIHSDQGSEYDSQSYTLFCEQVGISISMSNKSSPWENGYQESFFSHFKVELADVNRFNDLGELIEEINYRIWYYNTKRIHSKFKKSPFDYLESYYKLLGT